MALLTRHTNKHFLRHRTGQEDIRRKEKAKLTDGQTSQSVTVLQLLPVSEGDSSGQLRDCLGTTRVPVLVGHFPIGWKDRDEVRRGG